MQMTRFLIVLFFLLTQLVEISQAAGYALMQDTPKQDSFIKKAVYKVSSKAVKGISSPFIKVKHKVVKPNKNKYENIKNNAPRSYEDYITMTQDVKRIDIKLPQPAITKDEKIIDIPDPRLRIVKYNVPPGAKNINLSELFENRKVKSDGVLSPDATKMAYSEAYYYPGQNQITSELFLINVKKLSSLQDTISNAHEIQREQEPLLSTDFNSTEKGALKTLIVVDWSKDGNKIAIKEKIGSTIDGVWKTNLWVYDFQTKHPKQLNEVREAIKYWWKANNNLDLTDYMWDIFPVGWDSKYPDRIIVYAFAYTTNRPKFLGTWSIDYRGSRSELLSVDDTNFEISPNGYALKMVIRE